MSVCITYYFYYDSSTYTNELKKLSPMLICIACCNKKQLGLHGKTKCIYFIPLFILFSTLTYFDLKNECDYVYEYFHWSHFRNKASCIHIPKFEKCILMNIRVWEANFPSKDVQSKIVEVWSDAANKWWSETNIQYILYFLDSP